MPVYKSRLRSLSNIRTHGTARASSATETHKLYMKQTALEIERTRRIEERRSLLDRLASVEERIRSLTKQQDELSEQLQSREDAIDFEAEATGSKPASKTPTASNTFSY